MKEMVFTNQIYCENEEFLINTIRRGIKWGSLEVGESVDLLNSNGISIARGIVNSVRIKPFLFLNNKDLEFNFEPECRSFIGVFKKMREFYKDFDVTEIITSIDIELTYVGI